ncbi:TetR family transcriptional regulator [Frankia sp. Cas4]|uniref:TetR/AcrR family transcriptional regulator n=1 Tax=Frankia sp. Cas4 TaxID=3073927 RepID=UPI002AD494F4|nr:TetR family transcriptional regulator [Frankia sp. Cas4]
MISDTPHLGRAERRARTRAAILAAARTVFGECGYQGATIRAVAGRADVDPALVMQHFGSKEALFIAAAEIELGIDDALPGPIDDLGERLLCTLLERLESAPEATVSMLRSMLTHDQAAEAVRAAMIDKGASPLADIIIGDDAELRSGLVASMIIGLIITRYLLKIPKVAEAPAERLIPLFGPCLQRLITPADPGTAPGEPRDTA